MSLNHVGDAQLQKRPEHSTSTPVRHLRELIDEIDFIFPKQCGVTIIAYEVYAPVRSFAARVTRALGALGA